MPQPASGSEDQSGRSRPIGVAQLLLIVAVIAVALYFARAPERLHRDVGPAPAAETDKPVVEVLRPVPTTHTMRVELTGAVRLEERTSVSAEVVGRVIWVSPDFSNGGAIRADEPFLKIDPREYELRVEAAEMAVEAAQARVWAERARGEEALESFRRDNPGAEPSDAVRRLPWIAQAEAELGKERSALALARLRLARTSLSLPHDARVVTSEVDVGEVVGPAEQVGASSLLGVVYRPSALEVDAPIEVSALEDLRPAIGRSARVRTRSAVYDAQVTRVSSVVNPRSRLASVFLDFSEKVPPDSLPLPGSFVEVAIEGPARDNVYVLPESVIRERNRVWVVENGALRSLEPRALGHSADGWVVEAFDAADGVVVGSLPGGAEGLEVAVSEAGTSG